MFKSNVMWSICFGLSVSPCEPALSQQPQRIHIESPRSSAIDVDTAKAAVPPLSLSSNGKEFLRGFDAGKGKMRVWGRFTNDINSETWFNNGQFVIGSEGYNNAIVGFASNNLPPSTIAFPTALTGICYNKSNGNTCFGIYSEGHATKTGVAVAAEFAAFQDGKPAPTSYPFDNKIGTQQALAKGLQLTAGTTTHIGLSGTTTGNNIVYKLSSTEGVQVGQVVQGPGISYGTTVTAIDVAHSSMSLSSNPTNAGSAVPLSLINPSAVALEIGREGSSHGQWQYGIAVQPDAPLIWSYYQASNKDMGPRNGIFMGYNGRGLGAIFQPSTDVDPNNAVIAINNSQGETKASIRQNGHAFFGDQSTHGTVLTLQNSDGSCELNPASTAAAFSCTSDERLKSNIMDFQSAMPFIDSYDVRQYDLRSSRKHVIGVIAQELKKNHPELVHVNTTGLEMVEAPNAWLMIKGIQEVSKENNSLRTELRVLEAMLAATSALLVAIALRRGILKTRVVPIIS